MNNGDIMILETIAQANRERYAEIEKQIPLEEIKSKALSMNITNEFPFEKALAKGRYFLYLRGKKHLRLKE